MIRMLTPFFSRHKIAKDRVEGRFSIQKGRENSIRKSKNANFTKVMYLMDDLELKFCKLMVSVYYNVYTMHDLELHFLRRVL